MNSDSYKRLGYLHRRLELIYTDIIFAFLPYNTIFHYRQIFSPFLKSPTRLPTCLRHLLSVTNFPHNDNILVFNCFSFRNVTDMSPTFISDIYIGITATLPPLLPPNRNLHRHLHRQNRIYLKRSQSNYRIANFPKITQKGREQEDLKRKGITH